MVARPASKSQQSSSHCCKLSQPLCRALSCPLVVKESYGTCRITNSLGVLSGKLTYPLLGGTYFLLWLPLVLEQLGALRPRGSGNLTGPLEILSLRRILGS